MIAPPLWVNVLWAVNVLPESTNTRPTFVTASTNTRLAPFVAWRVPLFVDAALRFTVRGVDWFAWIVPLLTSVSWLTPNWPEPRIVLSTLVSVTAPVVP